MIRESSLETISYDTIGLLLNFVHLQPFSSLLNSAWSWRWKHKNNCAEILLGYYLREQNTHETSRDTN